jgi:hypothetical protein
VEQNRKQNRKQNKIPIRVFFEGNLYCYSEVKRSSTTRNYCDLRCRISFSSKARFQVLRFNKCVVYNILPQCILLPPSTSWEVASPGSLFILHRWKQSNRFKCTVRNLRNALRKCSKVSIILIFGCENNNALTFGREDFGYVKPDFATFHSINQFLCTTKYNY